MRFQVGKVFEESAESKHCLAETGFLRAGHSVFSTGVPRYALNVTRLVMPCFVLVGSFLFSFSDILATPCHFVL